MTDPVSKLKDKTLTRSSTAVQYRYEALDDIGSSIDRASRLQIAAAV